MINKARAKQPKNKSKSQTLKRICTSYGMSKYTFEKYTYGKDNIKYELNKISSIGSLQLGAFLVESDSMNLSTVENQYKDLVTLPFRDSKFIDKINKLYKVEPMEADYVELISPSHYVITKPKIYHLDKYYLILGHPKKLVMND